MMRALFKYSTILLFLSGIWSGNGYAQILVPEDLPVSGDVMLLKQKAGKLWIVQALPAVNGVRPVSIAYRNGGSWNRLPLVYLSLQANSKGIRITDIDLYVNRVYISGDFNLSGKSRNCLIFFETQTLTWGGDHQFFSLTQPPVVNGIAILDNKLYVGGQFGKINTTECANLAVMDKTNIGPMKYFNTQGAAGPVNAIETDSTLSSLFIAGNFHNIFGKAYRGLVKFTPKDSTLHNIGADSLSVYAMRRAGSRLLLWARRDSTGPREILIYANNNIIDPDGLDSTYELTSMFSHNGNLFFTGTALLSSSVRQSGLFLVSENSKTERVYPKLNQFQAAESFGGFIFVSGNFLSPFTSTQEGFKLARIDENYKRFYGRVFHDANSDGKYTQGTDIRVGNRAVKVLPFGLLIPVDRNGYFTFIVPKTKVVISAGIEKTSDLNNGFTYKFSSDTFTERLVDFPIRFLRSNYSNINVRVTAAAGWTCRKDTSELYVVKVSNNGLVSAQPDIKLSFSGKMILIKPFPAPDIIDPGQLTWSKQTLLPGDEKTYLVKLTTPSSEFSDNDQISFSAEVSGVPDDEPADNSDTLHQTVSSGLAPNAKYQYPEASDGDSISWLLPDAGKVDYVIRFTNTTADTVKTLVVRDTIATPDYVTYIQETGSSHSFSRYVYTTPALPEKVIVVYTFSNINLPPNPSGNTELVNSSGYVGFRLGLETNLSTGTDLRNRASVYLQNEAPILTNTVIAKVKNTGLRHIHSSGPLDLHPNPADDLIHFKGDLNKAEFELYSLQGQLLYQDVIENNRISLNQARIASGTYVYSVITPSGNHYQGLIIKN